MHYIYTEVKGGEIIFVENEDIQDIFWRYSTEEGHWWNFAYVLPQEEGEPTKAHFHTTNSLSTPRAAWSVRLYLTIYLRSPPIGIHDGGLC